MKALLFVSLLASTLAANSVRRALAQSPMPQKGVRVQLAATSNAVPMPAADYQDAWIVAVTADGRVYSGVDPITLPALSKKIKTTPFKRGQNLYIKADARTPYAKVLPVLDATRSEGIAPQVLLTDQPESSPGTIAPPKGVPVLLDTPAQSGSESVVVQVEAGKTELTLKIADQTIPWSELQTTLTQFLQSRREKVATVIADGRLPFAQVVHVIDACRSTGARVVLVTPDL